MPLTAMWEDQEIRTQWRRREGRTKGREDERKRKGGREEKREEKGRQGEEGGEGETEGGYEKVFSLLKVQHQDVIKLFLVGGEDRSCVFINIHTYRHHQIFHCSVWEEEEVRVEGESGWRVRVGGG